MFGNFIKGQAQNQYDAQKAKYMQGPDNGLYANQQKLHQEGVYNLEEIEAQNQPAQHQQRNFGQGNNFDS